MEPTPGDEHLPLGAGRPVAGAETGVAGFESGTWQGVRVARGTPDAVVQRLNKELITVIRSADIRSRLAGQGAWPEQAELSPHHAHHGRLTGQRPRGDGRLPDPAGADRGCART